MKADDWEQFMIGRSVYGVKCEEMYHDFIYSKALSLHSKKKNIQLIELWNSKI